MFRGIMPNQNMHSGFVRLRDRIQHSSFNEKETKYLCSSLSGFGLSFFLVVLRHVTVGVTHFVSTGNASLSILSRTFARRRLKKKNTEKGKKSAAVCGPNFQSSCRLLPFRERNG